MAIYLFSVRNILRGTIVGEIEAQAVPQIQDSAVVAAAYRAAQKLTDERARRNVDFTRRRGLVLASILAPGGSPEWTQDRAALWNKAEAADNGAQVPAARRLILGLPHELDDAQRLELVAGFLREHLVGRGMVADFSINRPVKGQDSRNYYAHVLLTTRTLAPDGFGPEVVEWGEKAALLRWRAAWADAVNNALARAGIDSRVDHRSLKAQGIEREPQKYRGPLSKEERIERAFLRLQKTSPKGKVSAQKLADEALISPSTARAWLIQREKPVADASGPDESENF